MNVLVKNINDHEFTDRVFTETQLARILGGSDQRRYGLVNRALKTGEIMQIRRGLYILSEKFRNHTVHPFALAQALHPGSYVSLETALAYHGWIPESVFMTSSITPSRKSKEYNHSELGQFTFHPLALHPLGFLELVDRVQIEGQTMLVASPLRAMMDLVCYRKIEWQNLAWIVTGLRIEYEQLSNILPQDFETLKAVYKHQRVKQFITCLQEALRSEQAITEGAQG